MPRVAQLLQVALSLGYPFLVFLGLRILEARAVALVLGVLLAARWAARLDANALRVAPRLIVPVLLVATVLGASAWQNDEQLLLMTPVAVNLALLIAFGQSLLFGPPLVETFARMRVPDLPEVEVRYCRSVTVVWCGFFLLNGAAAAWFALHGTRWAWTVYSGLVSYLLVATLFAIEFVVRSWRFGRYRGSLVEPIFRRIFRAPPDE